MSEPKFTPGPWKVAKPRKSFASGEKMYGINGPELVTDYEDWGFTKANAHLIAAAPDLYKALAHLEPYLDAIVCYASTIEEHPPNGFILETKAALAKARGEG